MVLMFVVAAVMLVPALATDRPSAFSWVAFAAALVAALCARVAWRMAPAHRRRQLGELDRRITTLRETLARCGARGGLRVDAGAADAHAAREEASAGRPVTAAEHASRG